MKTRILITTQGRKWIFVAFEFHFWTPDQNALANNEFWPNCFKDSLWGFCIVWWNVINLTASFGWNLYCQSALILFWKLIDRWFDKSSYTQVNQLNISYEFFLLDMIVILHSSMINQWKLFQFSRWIFFPILSYEWNCMLKSTLFNNPPTSTKKTTVQLQNCFLKLFPHLSENKNGFFLIWWTFMCSHRRFP